MMKKHLKIFLTLAAALVLGSCSKDDPFPDGNSTGETGQVMKSSLLPELKNEDGIQQVFNRPGMTTRAVPTADDFTVNFYLEGQESPVATYLYGEMPEIVTLPVGAVTAVATYGDNADAAWEAPYFKGQTQFIVSSGRVTDDVDPIVATLANVRVSIVFAPGLKAAMSADSKVTVVVGEQGSLDFTAADEERSGHFAYVENSRTLAATFSGNVDGANVVETKAYDNVAPGTHYRITFRLHSAAEDGEGDADASLTVDASVEVVDMNLSVDDEEDVITDDMRPVEGDPETPDNPNPPIPDDKKTPAVEPMDPAGENAGKNKLDVNVRNLCDNLYCAMTIISEAEGGITGFTVDIKSNTLTPEELEGVGLREHLDLVNPGDLEESLVNLGFPVKDGVVGKNNVPLDITGFMPMLSFLGPGQHDFVMTITDANGTTTFTLKLETK